MRVIPSGSSGYLMEGKPVCSHCSGRAVYLDRESGTHLCSQHLKESVQARVLNRIIQEKPLPDKFGVAFSGGKDSTALLAVLVALKEKIPSRLIALTVDEGIGGYREETIRHARDVCSRLNVEHRIITFPDLFGLSLDDFMKNSSRKACTICGILRRRALEVLADQEGVHLLATGHNQDDHAQTTLMNAFSADIKKVFAGSGRTSQFARRIKPFAAVSEREVTLYAILSDLFIDLPECPYASDAFRGEVRRLLNRFEQEHPGSMRNLAHAEEEIRSRLKGKVQLQPLENCKVCGWSGSGEICQVCTVLKEQKNKNNSSTGQ
ncbi:TIGR00269 family protein [Methanospirillum lacunae]|uniref:TIGR00269 family protein n=2 Tax=Methanospirillum lacunae TaxID=668570 RepID=A0A2V2N450_9EURY|nr:TIGR00269 family protein [Methanospirillum lacunae]